MNDGDSDSVPTCQAHKCDRKPQVKYLCPDCIVDHFVCSLHVSFLDEYVEECYYRDTCSFCSLHFYGENPSPDASFPFFFRLRGPIGTVRSFCSHCVSMKLFGFKSDPIGMSTCKYHKCMKFKFPNHSRVCAKKLSDLFWKSEFHQCPEKPDLIQELIVQLF